MALKFAKNSKLQALVILVLACAWSFHIVAQTCIPERWDVWPEADREGYWGCYEKEIEGEDTDTGTLWIQVDHFNFPKDRELPAEAVDMKRTAEEMEARSVREKKLD